MKISILTLFPNLFDQFIKTSIIGRAVKNQLVEFEFIDIRQFGEGVHQVVDGKPYGGGVGMIFKADILAKALKQATKNKVGKTKIILMSASGTPFKQQLAQELSKFDHLIIVCGHYEGVDQRFIDKYVDLEISIGDYVLTGGELPSMVVTDSITRLIPQVLKKEAATVEESFTENLLEYPHYTRPDEFEGVKVPPVLVSGNHQEVAKWRKEQAFEKTKRVRPDLLE